MIDNGELDWKIIAISKSDKLHDVLHDISDVESKYPHITNGTQNM
jgi:inorganic pyrophosphatase